MNDQLLSKMTPADANRYDMLKNQIAQLQSQLALLRKESGSNSAQGVSSPGASVVEEEQTEVLWTFDRVLRRFTYVNPRVEKLFGMRVGQALTAGPDQTSNPETYRRMVDAFEVLYQSGSADAMKPRQGLRNEEMRVYVRNFASGEAQIANYIIIAQQVGPDGAAVEIAGIYTQNALSVSGDNGAMHALESWEQLFAALPLPMFVMGIDMRVRQVNRVMLQLLGLEKPEDCVGQACYKLVHNMNSPHPNCPLMEAMDQNAFVRATINEPHLHGSYLFHTVPVGEEGALPTCALCLLCNVTSICENHFVLTEELARQSLAQQTGSFGIWSIPIDRSRKVSDFSPALLTSELYQLLNIDKKNETSFRPVLSFWQRVMSRDDYGKLVHILEELVNGQTAVGVFNFKRTYLQNQSRHAGSEHYCIKAVCRFTSEGYPSQIIGVVENVSSKEELRGRINQSNALLDVAYSSLEGGTFSLRIVPGKPVLLTAAVSFSAGARELLSIVDGENETVAALVKYMHPNDGQILLANFIDLALGSLHEVRMECRPNPSIADVTADSSSLSVHAYSRSDEHKEEPAGGYAIPHLPSVLIEGIICRKHTG